MLGIDRLGRLEKKNAPVLWVPEIIVIIIKLFQIIDNIYFVFIFTYRYLLLNRFVTEVFNNLDSYIYVHHCIRLKVRVTISVQDVFVFEGMEFVDIVALASYIYYQHQEKPKPGSVE